MNGSEAHGVRTVVDGDGHLMEDANLWVDYIEPGYRDVAPRLVADGDGARLMMDGRLFPIKSGPGVGRPRGLRYHSWRGRVYDHLSDDPEVRDQRPEVRLRDMDEMGVGVALLYPSVGLHVTVGTEDIAWTSTTRCTRSGCRGWSASPATTSGTRDSSASRRKKRCLPMSSSASAPAS